MNNVQLLADRPRYSAFDSHPEAIQRHWFDHPAFVALRTFNRQFSSRPLTRSELLLFLASMATFNRHTIGGIAILAGRLSDRVLPLRPRNGHEIGALVLDAAVDEYGLRESVTHVELARDFAAHLGISLQEIECADSACATAVELGRFLFMAYREMPVAFALGVHSASEATSAEEFVPWHDIFLKFSDYGFSPDSPQFEYMRAHSAHEPDHVRKTVQCVARYLELFPEDLTPVRQGMESFFTQYQHMFQELNSALFKSCGGHGATGLR